MIKEYKISVKSIILNEILLEKKDTELYNKVKDLKIKNPETGREIKVSTALSNKNHPAYSAAKKYLEKTDDNEEESIESIDKKIEDLKQEYKKANDDFDFDKVSNIVNQIKTLNQKKTELNPDIFKQQAQKKNEIQNFGKKFKNKDEVLKHINTKYKKIPKPILNPKEEQAASIYRGSGYKPINDHLRLGTKIDEETKKAIDDLHKAIDKSEIKEDVPLYRGMTLNGTLKNQLSNLKVGDSFTDNAFSSTSFDEEFIKRSYGGNHKDTVLFQINAKKGQKGLPMNNISTGGEEEDKELESELEILLPAKSKFKLVGVEGNKYIFEIED